MTKKLKLYVWEGVLHDWSDGMIVALAYTKEQAIRLVLEKDPVIPLGELAEEPEEVTEPAAFVIWGGG